MEFLGQEASILRTCLPQIGRVVNFRPDREGGVRMGTKFLEGFILHFDPIYESWSTIRSASAGPKG